MLVTSSQILAPIDGYESPSITCGDAKCFALKPPSNLGIDGFHHLSYLRLKTVGKTHLNNITNFHPSFLRPLWVSYYAFSAKLIVQTVWAVPDKKNIVAMTVLRHCPDRLVLIAGPDMIAGTPIFGTCVLRFADNL